MDDVLGARWDLTGAVHVVQVGRADAGGGRRIVLSLTAKGADLVERAGGELEAEFTAMLSDPRLDPAVSPGAIDATSLNAHLTTLTEIVLEKGRPT